MTDLTAEVRTPPGGAGPPDLLPWDRLIELYTADRDAFYRLAVGEPSSATDAPPLAELAGQVWRAVRESYRFDPPVGDVAEVKWGKPPVCVRVPAAWYHDVCRFLRDIDGKGIRERKGKDYYGRAVSAAEARFLLGDPADADGRREAYAARMSARPDVFGVDSADLENLKHQPPFVRHNLTTCARVTLLAPTAVYRGLGRGDAATGRLLGGWRVYGKPPRARDNTGLAVPVPPGYVFAVYADSERYVFDWDWVKEDPDYPGRPLGWSEHADRLDQNPPEFVFDLPVVPAAGRFDPAKATYSWRGDCIFCYLSDEPAYAERVNSDLTIFRPLDDRTKLTGFKVKNVRWIVEKDRSVVLDQKPDLHLVVASIPPDSMLIVVSVNAALLATLKWHKDTAVIVYTAIIEALLAKSGKPQVVSVLVHKSNDAKLIQDRVGLLGV